MALPEPLGDVAGETFDRQYGVDVRGTRMATRAAVWRFGRQGGVVVVNVSSVNWRRPAPRGSVCSATKAAVDASTEVPALELGPHGVGVNARRRGATDTDMLRGLHEGAEGAIARAGPGGPGGPMTWRR